jgi:hypothetical protein
MDEIDITKCTEGNDRKIDLSVCREDITMCRGTALCILNLSRRWM